MMLIGKVLKTMFIVLAIACIMFTGMVIAVNVAYNEQIQNDVNMTTEETMKLVNATSETDWFAGSEVVKEDDNKIIEMKDKIVDLMPWN